YPVEILPALLESVGISVALIGNKVLQDSERDSRSFGRAIFDKPGYLRNVGELGVCGQKVRHLKIGIQSRSQLAKGFEDQLVVVDRRGVTLLAADPLYAPNLRRTHTSR